MEPDEELLSRLQDGDESAFIAMVARYHGPMVRLARAFVPSDAAAEDAVQDTWVGVIRGVDRFEGRSSFKTWLFRILVNRARTTGEREHRHLPVDLTGPSVPQDRFDASGSWAEPVAPWESDVDNRVLAEAWAPALRQAVDALPGLQREVVVLRDMEGLGGTDVSEILGITEGNQRVLLHRGRARLRAALESELQSRGR